MKYVGFALLIFLVVGVINSMSISQKARSEVNSGSAVEESRTQKSDLSLTLCYEAQKAVRGYLKAPETTKFPNCTFGAHEYKISHAPAISSYFVFGHVDSQNTFGAMLRSEFAVKFGEDFQVVSVAVE